jgi:hypothetical protein
VYAVGTIQTDSPLVSSSYNIGVRSNGCPEVERFILSYETFDDDSEKIVEHDSEINFNVEYIIEKNIDNFTDADPSAKMLQVVARRVWDVNDSDFDRYAYGEQTSHTKEKYKTCAGETSPTLGKNTRVYRNDNAVELGAGFYKTSGSSFDELSYTTTYREIEDGEDTIHRVDLEFNEQLEAIGYHTFYLGKHYNDDDVPDESDGDDYISYYDSVGDSYYYFPGEKSANINPNTFFDGKLDCTYTEQREDENYVPNNGAKREYRGGGGYYSESNQNEYLFEESDNIKGIKTGKYLRIIGNQAFKKLRNLEYIDFENSPLERIGMYAFEGCTSLSAITIPDTVSLIGEGAFKRSGIESVEIPSGMTMIEAETFRLCKNLEEVDFSNCTRLYKICNDAFRGCWNISGLTFPSSLVRIERMAFGECDSIEDVTFNSGLKYIGYRAFDKCSSLTNLTISAETIEEKAFNRCGLTSVTLSNTVKTIGNEAFARCQLSSVTLPSSSALTIGEKAFYDNNIHSVNIPSVITSIGPHAFKGTEFVVYQGNATGSPWGAQYAVAVIRDGFAYEDTGMTTLVTYEYNNVQSISIPNSVTSIKERAFYDFFQLETAIISNNVRTIGKEAFYYCTALTDVTIGTSVMSIEQDVFSHCEMLSAVTIPSSVRTIGPGAFTACNSLENLTIQNGTTGISSSAFANCNSLTDVSLPNSVSEIGGSAFIGCTGLRTVTFGTGITTLGQSAFANCSGLRTIVIPSTVTGIPTCCFCNCTSLTSVQIGTGVTAVNYAAFSGCTSLNTIRYDGTKEQWRDNVSRPSYTWHEGVQASVVTCSNGTFPIGQ